MKRLFNLKMKEGSPIVEHLNELHMVLNQLTSLKIVFDDEIQALLLLSSMPDSWKNLVVTISNVTPKGKLCFEDVSNSLLNEEMHMKSMGEEMSNMEALTLGDVEGNQIERNQGDPSLEVGQSLGMEE
jgi:hypothetical protein